MNGSHQRRVWLVVAGAVAAVVLGVATTALLAASGAFRGELPVSNWSAPRPQCAAPALTGHVVDVTVGDMGPGMMGGPNGQFRDGNGPGWHGVGRMRLVVAPGTVPAGMVSLRVFNAGTLTHEVLVLPLAAGQAPGARPIGADSRIDESGSLSEASASCAAGAGSGIAPGGVGWTTVALGPGRYELVCDFPGHYAAGMYDEFDVIGP